MLLDFLFVLRRHKIPVGLQEWMALMKALSKGLHQSSLTGFYHLARSILIHSESHFDNFDCAFAEYFKGIEKESLELTDEIADWLANPGFLDSLSPAQRAALESLNLDQLRRMFAERLREQMERHQGGSHWIGTGGTSPFGQGGYHPTGLRLGDLAGGRSAAQIAAERRFQAYRNDLILDVRQIKVALRKLRELQRDGQAEELDLDATIDQTCRNAGELELIWQAPRKNSVKLILLMDVGGSMTPHARLVSQLFSAAKQSNHFREFKSFYFHNCVYDKIYDDPWLRKGITIKELLSTYGSHYKLVLVGDALMHPLELFEVGGMINYWSHNHTPGIEWLRRLATYFTRKVWLNPEPKPLWNHSTIRAIKRIFPMFPLTINGLENAVDSLIKGRAA